MPRAGDNLRALHDYVGFVGKLGGSGSTDPHQKKTGHQRDRVAPRPGRCARQLRVMEESDMATGAPLDLTGTLAEL